MEQVTKLKFIKLGEIGVLRGIILPEELAELERLIGSVCTGTGKMGGTSEETSGRGGLCSTWRNTEETFIRS